jgi:peptide/nickel transport system substrate-binding protein
MLRPPAMSGVVVAKGEGVSGRMTRVVAALAVFAVVAAGCSKKNDGGGDAATVTSAAAPTTTAASGGDGSPTTTPATSEAPATTVATAAVPGGTLLVSGESEVANPWVPGAMQCDAYCHQRARTFFEPVAARGVDGTVHGILAETITPNDAFTEWTVAVRPGIVFHDGTPLDAAAIVQNLQEAGASLLISAALKDVAKNPDGSLKIEIVDPMTFTVYTGRNGDPADPMPWPGFANTLTTQWALIASPTWLDAVAARTADASMPIGTGPFVVERYAPRDALVVTKNPDYWRTDANGVQLPYLDRIEFRVIEDPQTAAEALVAGDIDFTSTGYSAVIADFRDDAQGMVLSEKAEYGSTTYLMIDLDKAGPLQDRDVRCALSLAVDRPEMNELINAGVTTPANGLFSPGQEGHLADNGLSLDRDVEAAAAAIAAYEAETGTEVVVPLGVTSTVLNLQAAELLAGYWAEIGVDTDIVQVPQDQFITNALFGVPEFTMYLWANHAGTIADEQYYWWHSANAAPDGQLALNFGRIRDEVVDAGLEQARSGLTADERREGAEQVNRRFAEQCFQIPLSWNIIGNIRIPALQGVGTAVAPDGTPLFEYATTSMAVVWLDPDA